MEQVGDIDGETMSVSSSSKRIKEMSIDRLSALPDSLIIDILSFLEMKEAAITSVLSKRWQFLWTESPRFIFRGKGIWAVKVNSKFVAWVNRTLPILNGNGLEKFVVDFWYYKLFASDVDVWIGFAVKNKVKEVNLLLTKYGDEFHVLPQLMYSNSSLTRLCLRGCIIAPQGTIEWPSLSKLLLENTQLHRDIIEKILSGCPVLHTLCLSGCWGFHFLEIKSQSLYKLEVHDQEYGSDEPLLQISAPYIRSLHILQHPGGRQLRLINIPSVVKASIFFFGIGWEASQEDVLSNTKEVYENLKHVKELSMGSDYMQVGGEWLQLPKSRRGCLRINAYREKQSISGIVGLLESSPDLETLTILICDPDEESVTLGPAATCDLDCCDLLHLKTVNIIFFADPKFGIETMLSLAQILLRRATILEKMMIDAEKTTFPSTRASSDFATMAQTLLHYQRASQKATVLLRQ